MSNFQNKIDRSLEKIRKEISLNSAAFQAYVQTEQFEKERNRAHQRGLKLNIGEHRGKPFLLIPNTFGDNGARNGRKVQNSIGVNLLHFSSRRPARIINPNQKYLIEVEVENKGDIYMPCVSVEFFLSKRMQAFDVEFTIGSISIDFVGLRVKGRLEKGRISIGDHVEILGADATYLTRVEGIIKDTNSGRGLTTAHTAEDIDEEITLMLSFDRRFTRTFQREIKPGDKVVNANRVPLSNRSFRMRVESADRFTIQGRGVFTIIEGTIEQGIFDYRQEREITILTGLFGEERRTRNQYAVKVIKTNPRLPDVYRPGSQLPLTTKANRHPVRKGDIIELAPREKFNFKRAPYSDSTNIADQEHLGTIITHVNAFSAETLLLPWDAPGEKNRRDFIFTARAYSTGPHDMPTNFDDLNAGVERHVGCKKIVWEARD